MKKNKVHPGIIIDLIMISIFFGTVYFMIRYMAHIDIKDHNLLLEEYLKAGYFPFPPGYYALIYFLDLFIRVKYPFVASTAISLTVLMYLKYKLTFNWLNSAVSKPIKEWGIVLLTVSLLFLSPIYFPPIDGDLWYLGKFTSTIWHNSTLICVFPLCILLLRSTLDWMEHQRNSDGWMMLVFSVGILLIKPSFIFCFIPALPSYLWIKEKGLTKKVLRSIGLVSVLFVLVLIEKHVIFSWDPMIEHLYSEQEKSVVVIQPFHVWLNYSKEPVFDFLSSFPLLITFLILWKKEAFRSSFFNLTFILLFYSLSIYFIFSETGFREFHGNFYWQIPIALFLNNLSILIAVFGDDFHGPKKMDQRTWVISAVLSLQFLLGVIYWVRIFSEKTLS